MVKTGSENRMGVCNVGAMNEDVGVVKQAAKISISKQEKVKSDIIQIQIGSLAG